MSKVNTIIFDLDGTLLDTLDDLSNSVNYALTTHHYPIRTKEEIRSFLGNGIASLMRRAVPTSTEEAKFQEAFESFRTHYIKHCLDLTHPYENIMPLLEALRQKHVKMAIVSNKLHPAVQELNRRFFMGLIETAIGESATVRRKPNPDAVVTALHELGSNQEEAIYVGDSEVDIETAKNAGMRCACVTWGFRDKDFLIHLHPDYLIEAPLEILKLLNK